MAKGFKHGGGGGSAPSALNFRVVGGTAQPAAPKENDIWVHTDTEITGWVFSPAEPTEPAEGLVWIVTGTSSAAAFNALKKNALVVCPLSCRQYIAGEWTEMTANSRQDGAWVDWWVPGTLFANGTDGTDLTGGWESYKYSAGSGYTGVTETIDISSDGMRVVLDDAGGTYRATFIGTGAMVPLDGYSKLTVKFSEAAVSIANTGAVAVRLYSDGGYTVAKSAEVLSTTGTFSDTVELDISDLSGEHRIGFFLWKWNASCVVSANMTMAQLS